MQQLRPDLGDDGIKLVRTFDDFRITNEIVDALNVFFYNVLC